MARMRSTITTMNVAAGVAVGTALPVKDDVDKWDQVHGISGATIAIEGTVDGNNWNTVGNSASAITADGIYEIPEGVASLRVNKTVAGSGSPTVVLFHRSARTD